MTFEVVLWERFSIVTKLRANTTRSVAGDQCHRISRAGAVACSLPHATPLALLPDAWAWSG